MDEKDAQLALEGGAELLGLPLGDVDRDDHVSELEGHPRDFIALSAHLIVESVAFERKNVSGTGLSAEFPVETGHLIVVNEAHGGLSVLRAVLLGEHEGGKLGDGDARDEVLLVFTVHFDVHENLLARFKRQLGRRRQRLRQRGSGAQRLFRKGGKTTRRRCPQERARRRQAPSATLEGPAASGRR